MRSAIAILALVASAWALGSEDVFLQYAGRYVRGNEKSQVVCEIIHKGDVLYVASRWDGSSSEFLSDGTRALFVSRSPRNTGQFAVLRDPLFVGLDHVPYFPLAFFGRSDGRPRELTMVTREGGGRKLDGMFSMPIRSERRTSSGYRVEAEYKGVTASVVQTGLAKVSGYVVPRTSVERYVDGGGPFDYEWKLAKVATKNDCPPVPSFEDLLGSSSIVMDFRKDNAVCFGYTKGSGSFDEQRQKGKEQNELVARQARMERNSVVLTAVLTGLAVAGAGGLLFWRSRVGKT